MIGTLYFQREDSVVRRDRGKWLASPQWLRIILSPGVVCAPQNGKSRDEGYLAEPTELLNPPCCRRRPSEREPSKAFVVAIGG